MYPGSNAGQKYQSNWHHVQWRLEKAGEKAIIIKGSEIRLHSNNFENMDENTQIGVAWMILWIGQFTLKSNRTCLKSMFRLLRQSQCVLSMA